MKQLLLSFLILLGFSGGTFAEDKKEEIEVFILAGQSNAQGWQGNAAKYPADPQGLDAKIRFWWVFPGNSSSEGKWTTMKAQGGRFPAGHFGPEVSLARKLLKDGHQKVAVFKYCQGATSIANNWKGPGEKGLYDDMAKQLKAAIAILEKEGLDVKVRGFFWVQGESDAQTPQMAVAYHARLKTLVNDLRLKVLKEPKLPCLLGVDEKHEWVQKNPQVIEAQKKLAGELPCAVYCPSLNDLPKADSTHLTPESLVKQGEVLAAAWQKLSTHGARK